VLPRLLRAGAVAVAVVLVTVLVFPPPAEGHAGLALTVSSDGRGSVAVDVTWEDGHPVTDPIAATMVATSATATVGPVPLRRLPGTPTVVYEGTLPPGTWAVTVDAALPGIGHCGAVVTVGGPTPSPGSIRCAPSVAAAPPPQEAEGGDGDLLFVGLGVIALAGAAGAGLLLLTRRRR